MINHDSDHSRVTQMIMKIKSHIQSPFIYLVYSCFFFVLGSLSILKMISIHHQIKHEIILDNPITILSIHPEEKCIQKPWHTTARATWLQGHTLCRRTLLHIPSRRDVHGKDLNLESDPMKFVKDINAQYTRIGMYFICKSMWRMRMEYIYIYTGIYMCVC